MEIIQYTHPDMPGRTVTFTSEEALEILKSDLGYNRARYILGRIQDGIPFVLRTDDGSEDGTWSLAQIAPAAA